jgi:hypothetical protein
MELEELKIALNWTGVFQGTNCLVIHCDENELGLLTGVKSNEHCFYLDYPEFQEQPISFSICRGPETFQYYVLGDRLNRIGAPAKITHNTDTNVSHLIYFENGLKHNDNGPAEIIIRGQSVSAIHPRTQEDMGPNYIVEEWDEYESYWFTRGVQSLYPTPHSMLCSNGYRIFRTTSDVPVLENYNDESAFCALTLMCNWSREGSALEEDAFRVRFMQLADYYRNFKNHEPQSHGCKEISKIGWVSNGELVSSPRDKRERVRLDLFPSWNIFEGPFFPNSMEKIFAINEAI